MPCCLGCLPNNAQKHDQDNEICLQTNFSARFLDTGDKCVSMIPNIYRSICTILSVEWGQWSWSIEHNWTIINGNYSQIHIFSFFKYIKTHCMEVAVSANGVKRNALYTNHLNTCTMNYKFVCTFIYLLYYFHLNILYYYHIVSYSALYISISIVVSPSHEA